MATNTPAGKPADSGPSGSKATSGTSSTGTADTPSSTSTSSADSGSKGDTATASSDSADTSEGKPSRDLMDRVAKRAPHVDSKFVSEYGMTNQDLEDIASGLQPAPPRVGPIHNVDLHRTPGGWQITPVGVKPEDLPETGRVPADVLAPGLTQGDDLSGALSQGEDLK